MTIFLYGLAGVGTFLSAAAFVGWVYLRFWRAPDLGWGWTDIPTYLAKGTVGLIMTGAFVVFVFIVGLGIVALVGAPS